MVRKRFGQNFLTDRRALQRIVEALELRGAETVLEIGPGKGALTDLLVDRCQRLFGIEIDRDLATLLRERYQRQSKVEIVAADVLTVDLHALAGGPYVLVGNVPYYVTTPIIFHALRSPRPSRVVLLVQREVAERMTASPSTRAYGALTVNVQLVAEVEMMGRIGPGSFVPRPTVESEIVRLRPRETSLVAGRDEDAVRAFVIGLFGQRRRQLPRAVRTVTQLDAAAALAAVHRAGLDPLARPENLAPEEFVTLFRAVRAAGEI
ncbi:MAG: 16S rRNA (adenine(1518)-N(6)/adenine(1519)-N(6))-dimethyltransferase RsmA [Gemmatimonadaceae bacterium]